MAYWATVEPLALINSRLSARGQGVLVTARLVVVCLQRAQRRVRAGSGYPDDRITRVQNAIDTAALAAAAARVDDEQLASLRAELGVVGGNVCIFVGAMYADKRLPFLLEACELIRRDVPDFEIIFVGDGPESAVVREAADHAPWIHYVGARFDDGKVPYFLLANLR